MLTSFGKELSQQCRNSPVRQFCSKLGLQLLQLG
jgi:hypothetical protein